MGLHLISRKAIDGGLPLIHVDRYLATESSQDAGEEYCPNIYGDDKKPCLGESFVGIDLGAKEGFACGVSLQTMGEAVTRRISRLIPYALAGVQVSVEFGNSEGNLAMGLEVGSPFYPAHWDSGARCSPTWPTDYESNLRVFVRGSCRPTDRKRWGIEWSMKAAGSSSIIGYSSKHAVFLILLAAVRGVPGDGIIQNGRLKRDEHEMNIIHGALKRTGLCVE